MHAAETILENIVRPLFKGDNEAVDRILSRLSPRTLPFVREAMGDKVKMRFAARRAAAAAAASSLSPRRLRGAAQGHERLLSASLHPITPDHLRKDSGMITLEQINRRFELRDGEIYVRPIPCEECGSASGWVIANAGAKEPAKDASWGSNGRCVSVFGQRVSRAKVMIALAHGRYPARVKHLDGDINNCSLENLSPVFLDPLPKGVTRTGSRYMGRFRAGGELHYAGSFDTPEEAAEALARIRDAMERLAA